MFRVSSKVWRRAAFLVLAIFILLTPSALMAEQAITIHIDGKVIESDVAPLIVKDRTMVPIRVISEKLGCEVLWQGTERRVLISTPGTKGIEPRTVSPRAQRGIGIFIDGKEVKIGPEDPAPFIVDGRTMVPLRMIAEGLGMEVDWDPDNRRVLITTPGATDNEPIIDKEVPPVNNIDYQQTIMGEAKMGREQLLAVMQENNPAAPQELVDLYL